MQACTSADFMNLALSLAECGRNTVAPNPMVGCVIVNHGRVVGRGFHSKAGQDHAEILALAEAGSLARGAEMYVTLEPCAHHGRTPPCSAAIILAGISKVYVACTDPNPQVNGLGIASLRAHGIAVELGLAHLAAKQLNEVFFHYITYKLPFVISKLALSLNGASVAVPRQLSGQAAQQHTHNLRRQVGAVIVGGNTAIADNPALTARMSDGQLAAEQPLRVILAGQRPIPASAQLFNLSLPGTTLIVATSATQYHYRNLVVQDKIVMVTMPSDEHGRVALPALLEYLASCAITSILVEGGMSVHNSFMAANLVNKWLIYIAPTFVGADLSQVGTLQLAHSQQLGGDLCLEYKVLPHV